MDWLDHLIKPNAKLAELAAERDMLIEERDTLGAEVTALAEQVEVLTAALANQRRDLRAEVRKARELAFLAHEPVQVGGCTKVRYLHREDAAAHAAQIAIKAPGDVFNTYLCKICPRYPGTPGRRPWHVGHAGGPTPTSVWADDTTLYYHCGCQFGIHDHGADRTCLEHGEAG